MNPSQEESITVTQATDFSLLPGIDDPSQRQRRISDCLALILSDKPEDANMSASALDEFTHALQGEVCHGRIRLSESLHYKLVGEICEELGRRLGVNRESFAGQELSVNSTDDLSAE